MGSELKIDWLEKWGEALKALLSEIQFWSEFLIHSSKSVIDGTSHLPHEKYFLKGIFDFISKQYQFFWKVSKGT